MPPLQPHRWVTSPCDAEQPPASLQEPFLEGTAAIRGRGSGLWADVVQQTVGWHLLAPRDPRDLLPAVMATYWVCRLIGTVSLLELTREFGMPVRSVDYLCVLLQLSLDAASFRWASSHHAHAASKADAVFVAAIGLDLTVAVLRHPEVAVAWLVKPVALPAFFALLALSLLVGVRAAAVLPLCAYVTTLALAPSHWAGEHTAELLEATLAGWAIVSLARGFMHSMASSQEASERDVKSQLEALDHQWESRCSALKHECQYVCEGLEWHCKAMQVLLENTSDGSGAVQISSSVVVDTNGKLAQLLGLAQDHQACLCDVVAEGDRDQLLAALSEAGAGRLGSAVVQLAIDGALQEAKVVAYRSAVDVAQVCVNLLGDERPLAQLVPDPVEEEDCSNSMCSAALRRASVLVDSLDPRLRVLHYDEAWSGIFGPTKPGGRFEDFLEEAAFTAFTDWLQTKVNSCCSGGWAPRTAIATYGQVNITVSGPGGPMRCRASLVAIFPDPSLGLLEEDEQYPVSLCLEGLEPLDTSTDLAGTSDVPAPSPASTDVGVAGAEWPVHAKEVPALVEPPAPREARSEGSARGVPEDRRPDSAEPPSTRLRL